MSGLFRKLLCFILIFFSALVIASCSDTKTSKPRHVVFITVDTTRFDHIGIYGNQKIRTPKMDALAKDSVIFTQCYSTTHTTIPSHTSMFTSLYLKDHGVINMGQSLPEFKDFLPKIFQRAGYKTAAFTSGGHLTPLININQGFDDFFYTEKYEIIAEENMDKISDWLDKNYNQSFFIWTHFFDPHREYDPPAPYSTMYNYTSNDTYESMDSKRREKFEKVGYFAKSRDPEYFRNLYKGEVSYMDAQIGRLLDKLKALKLYEDSIIILVADHGEYLGEHGIFFTHGGGLYDEVTRVPFFIKSGREKQTGFRDHLVSIVDIFPTILELVALETSQPIRGEKLNGIMRAPSATEIRNRVYFESVWRVTAGVKTKDYTYIRDLYNLDETEMVDGFKFAKKVTFIEDPKGRQMLFDNHKDPDQETNLTDTVPEILADFEKNMVNFSNDIIEVSQKATTITDKEHIKKLKALGYIK